ncbi:MAG TPA: hypothetical protein VJT67_15050 [Longimicrobiaceae bacterium]|nr:hypothetical protein [Longimicrobiaceae bacterium]
MPAAPRRTALTPPPLRSQPAQEGAPPPSSGTFQVRSRVSDPADRDKAAKQRREQTLKTPIKARAQFNFVDDKLRTPVRSNFPLDFDRDDPPFVDTGSTIYQIETKRAEDEQASSSRPMNVLADSSRPTMHGSHSGQHSTAGDSSRLNMDPVAASANVGSIKRFEDAEKRKRQSVSGVTLTGEEGPRTHQVVRSRYDAQQVLPRLAASSTLDALDADSATQPLANAVRTQADYVPVEQIRTMSDGRGQISQHHLDLAATLGQPAGQVRNSAAHLRNPKTLAKFNRHKQPTGRPDQFKTKETISQQMDNELAHQHLLRAQPRDDPAAREVREAFEQVKAGKLMTGSSAIAQIIATAKEERPRIGTGARARKEQEELETVTKKISGVEPRARTRGEQKRKTAGTDPANAPDPKKKKNK